MTGTHFRAFQMPCRRIQLFGEILCFVDEWQLGLARIQKPFFQSSQIVLCSKHRSSAGRFCLKMCQPTRAPLDCVDTLSSTRTNDERPGARTRNLFVQQKAQWSYESDRARNPELLLGANASLLIGALSSSSLQGAKPFGNQCLDPIPEGANRAVRLILGKCQTSKGCVPRKVCRNRERIQSLVGP